MPTQAAPLVVMPSGQFLGNDGAWSSFLIKSGTPPQDLQVLVSTQVAATWVVAPNGCTSADASNCTQARGGSFDPSKSTTWAKNDLFQLDAEVNLGYTGNNVNGTYGYDTLAISQLSEPAAIPVQRQVVADIITERFYVGTLGINAAPINFSTSDPSDSALSLLTSLKNQNSIPSQSFGYTAGASYKADGVNGSLTLGGYDASRFTPNNVSFTFAPAKTRQLVASVQSITYSDSKGQQPLMSDGILALVDSTVPYLWLPRAACQVFEKVFGITWDPIANLYLINETTHSTLAKRNPSVIFEISNSLSGGPSVNITLPYASFDLNASYPLVKNQQRYFPLQVAADENSYTLGRTFFQEAYMIVNFENSTFSVSQAVYDSKTPSHIVAIAPSSPGSGTSPGPSSTVSLTPVSSNSGSGGIGSGAIAGIVVAFILVAIIVALAFFCIRYRRKKRRAVAELSAESSADGKDSPMSDVKESSFFQDSPPPKDQSVTAMNIAQVPMIPPMSPAEPGTGINEFYRPDTPGSPLKPLELVGDKPPRSELSSPERPSTPIELPSPDPQAIRSELSTPEPVYPDQELPTPDPSHELRTEGSIKRKPEVHANRSSQALPDPAVSSQAEPSSALVSPTMIPPTILSDALLSPAISVPSDHSAAESDAESDHALSALNSPRLPLQRPTSLRMDSSDSEAPFTRDGLPTRAFSTGGRRQNSSSSDLPMTSNFAPRRPAPRRTDTDSSDQSNVSQMTPAIAQQPQIAKMWPSGSASFVAVRPPQNRGLSQDGDTWETRLEMNSGSEGEDANGNKKRKPVGIARKKLPEASSSSTRDKAKRSASVPEANPLPQQSETAHKETAVEDNQAAAAPPPSKSPSEGQDHIRSQSEDMHGFATRPTQPTQPRGHHRRAITAEEQRIKEGLVGGGVLTKSQTETEMEEPAEIVEGKPEAVASGALQKE